MTIRLLSMEGVLHVLVITGIGICLIGGDVKDGSLLDREVLVVNGVTGADLGALGVEGNGERAASLDTGSLASVVNDRLVVLQSSQRNPSSVGLQSLTSYEPWEKFMRTTLRPTTFQVSRLFRDSPVSIGKLEPYLCGEH